MPRYLTVLSSLGVAQQKLNRAKISRAAVDDRRFCAPERMGPEFQRIQTDAGGPLTDQACVLPGGEAARLAPTPGKQKLSGLPSGQPQVIIDRLTGLLGKLEPHRVAGLPLANGCSVERVAVRRHVIHANGDNIAAAQLTVDGEVEQGEVTHAPIELQLGPDDLPLFQGSRREWHPDRGILLWFMVCLRG